MLRSGPIAASVLATAWLLASPSVRAAPPATPAEQNAAGATPDAVSKEATPNGAVGQLTVTVGKSLTLDSPLAIRRIALGNGALVDTQAISPREILINGKVPGETSLIVWREDGTRLVYDLSVRPGAEPRFDKPGEDK
jgi:pilus assembly protein CpaC